MLIFIEAAWHVLVQLAPWMLLGTLIAGLLHVLLPSGFVHRKLQGPSGVLKAVGIGVPLPLCSCGVIPAGIGLKKDGASDGACVGFLISTPQTGIDSILVSASFLGWPFALFKVLSAAVTGIVGGLLVDHFRKDGSVANERDRTQTTSLGTLAVTWRVVHHGVDIIRSIWLWLVFGILASAAIEVYVPESFLTGIGSMGILASALAALAVSLPLYVCATASVPIAAALVAGGLPPGAAIVFLMAGPATNVATMGAILRQFGGRVLAIYMATIIAGSAAAAVAFDWLLSAAPAIQMANHQMHHTWWAQGCAVLLVGLFVWFLLDNFAGRLRRCAGKPADHLSEVKIAVHGMQCGNCVARLEKVLRGMDGVHSAVVNLDPGEAIVRGGPGEDQIREVIRQAGFQPE